MICIRDLKKLPKSILIVNYKPLENPIGKLNKVLSMLDENKITVHFYSVNLKIKPDLIILINNTFRFENINPLLIADAEIYFCKKFSLNVFFNSLIFYSNSQIKNGL